MSKLDGFPTPISSPNLKRSHSEISVINHVEEDDDLNTCQLPQGFDFKINQVPLPW